MSNCTCLNPVRSKRKFWLVRADGRRKLLGTWDSPLDDVKRRIRRQLKSIRRWVGRRQGKIVFETLSAKRPKARLGRIRRIKTRSVKPHKSIVRAARRNPSARETLFMFGSLLGDIFFLQDAHGRTLGKFKSEKAASDWASENGYSVRKK